MNSEDDGGRGQRDGVNRRDHLLNSTFFFSPSSAVGYNELEAATVVQRIKLTEIELYYALSLSNLTFTFFRCDIP